MPTDHPAKSAPKHDQLCMLCQVNPVDPGKKVCTACWQLAPGWVKRTFMKGETVEITDENDVKYEPVFRVTFKKTG